MKTKFFALVALVLGMASCAKDFAPETQVGGEVDFRLSVAAPELVVTRAGENGLDDGIKGYDSAYGAIDYFQGDWSKMDLRYSLEVYDKTNKATYANVTPIKDRMVKILDKYEPVEFDLRLVPGRDYHFVVFADFVPEGTYLENAENSSISFNNWLGYGHYIGATLADIQNNQWDERVKGFRDQINKEECDAYYATIDVEKLSNTSASSVVLRRPYAKLRVIATDLAELNLNVDPGKIEVVYETGHNHRFNAVTGLFSGSATNKAKTYEYEYDESVGKKSLANHYYTAGYDAKTTTNANGEVRHTHMTLFTDYILTGSEQTSIHFTINVFDKKGDLIKSTPFNTDIPVQRNFLTTVIGNVLTTATEVEVSIDDNFASDIDGNSQERILLETLINGGVYDLTSDLTITAPTHLTGDAVIRLNGYTLTYDIPTDKENAKDFAIMTRVEDGASLTFVGEGSVVSEGYIASANEGGVINVSEGTFTSTSCTVFQSNGGEVNISGGEFQAAPYNGDYRYTINFIDAKADTGRINISGGRFYMYNPERSNSENPEMNFVVDGYWATEDGDWFVVEKAKDGWYDETENKVVAYSSKDLLKWSWIVNKTENRSCSLDVKRNITLPMYTVEEDAANEAYVYTTTPITITNGVPSGSNWVTAGAASKRYIDGVVEGNGHSINNLTMNSSTQVTGFIGRIHNGEVHNLTFNRANIYSTSSYVAPIAYVEDGAYITNVHTKNSNFYGKGYVAGISAELQERYYKSEYPDGRQKNLPATRMENCSVDANTVVCSTGSIAGGIIGQLYGAILYNCASKANVTGTENVGGLVGHMWAYFADRHAYIINCSCADAVITASGNNVGGLVGLSQIDTQTTGYAHNFVVGSSCDVTINCDGLRAGAIVGYNSNAVNYTSIYGCYAVSNLPVIAAGNAKAETSFAKANLTAEDIATMNEGVKAYNDFADAYVFPDPFTCKQDMLLPQATLW